MTIKLHSWYPTANTSGLYTIGEQFDPPDPTPRYCASCGCKLRLRNRSRICDPCDLKARIAHDQRQAWLHARGLL